MARPRRTDQHLGPSAREVVRQTHDSLELRQALAVLLPAELNATLEQTARVLGVGRATVPRFQSGFRQRCRGPDDGGRKGWGGRRRTLMSFEEELDVLLPWAEQAEAGGGVGLAPIRAALAQRLGRKGSAPRV